MCDSIVAVGAQTAAGATLYGKNSDRKPGECQPLLQHPAAHHPPGARLRATHIEIPQAPETHRVLGHSPWWVWGFEHGVNEHGVAVGNHTVFSVEPLEDEPGLIGMDLVRLALERAPTARRALEVMAELIETHGQGGAALAPGGAGYHNSFVLADPGEAWQLEASNRRWAARRVALGSVSNHLAIGSDWELGSPDLEAFARAERLWQAEGRLDVAAAYRNRHVPARISEGRCRRAAELLGAGRGKHDAASFQAILRDHAAGGAVWSAGDATPDEERFFTLCAHSDPIHRTTASLVAALPADRGAPWPVWVSFAVPCAAIFLPVYVDGVIPADLARGGETPDDESAWWLFQRLDAAVAADPPRHTSALRRAFAALEGRIEAERRRVEAEAARAARAGERECAAALVSDFSTQSVEAAMAQARALLAGLG